MVGIRYSSDVSAPLMFDAPPCVTTFNDIYHVFKMALGSLNENMITNSDFMIKINNEVYVGGLIPYNSKISDYVTNNIIDVIEEDCIYDNDNENPFETTSSNADYLMNLFTFSAHITLVIKSVRSTIEENRRILEELIPSLPNTDIDFFSPWNNVTLARIMFGGIMNSDGIVTLTNQNHIDVLSLEGFNSLKSKVFSVATASIGCEGDKICTVCQCDFEERDIVKILPCEHSFHEDCIKRWLMTEKNECPMCRGVVSTDPTHINTTIQEEVHVVDLSEI